MKYQLIQGSRNDLSNAVTTTLLNRGLDNISKYLNASKEDCEHYSLLENIYEAYEMLMYHIEAGHYIEILVDCDCDGFTSAAILYDYIVNNYDYEGKVGYILHEGKAHGLSDESVCLDERTKLLIIPDASSNEEELHREFKLAYDVNILVLDHHECDSGYSSFATVVNNQLSEQYTNKSLSGVGVVYKFLQLCDDEFDDWSYSHERYADDYLDMVAVGLIGDVMNMVPLENRYLVNSGLTLNLNNKFLSTLMEKESFSIGYELTPIKVSFNVVPLINAMIRVGDTEEQTILFRAMCNMEEYSEYKSRTKGLIQESLQEKALRLCKSAKGKQSRARDKAFKEILEVIEMEELDKHSIIMVDVTEILDSRFTGLVAIKVAEYFNKPALLYRTAKEDGCVGGSARNTDHSGLQDLRKFCNDTELFEFCQGHGNAFGFEIKREKIDELLKVADETLDNVADSNVTYVDFDVDFEDVSPLCYMDIYKARRVWTTNGIEEPKAHIYNLWCNTSNITISDKGYMKIKLGDVDVVQLGVNENHPIYILLDDLFGEDADVELEIIGTIGMNDFKGNLTKQIRIEQLEIKTILRGE